MKIALLAAPWYEEPPTPALVEACRLLGDNVWRDAAIDFYAKRAARLRRGNYAPKGMQGELNRIVADRFQKAGWIGADGRFASEDTWVRITFRHQMSLGSDLLDAVRLHAKEGYRQTAIIAGESSLLQLVCPNDMHALVSFEKLKIAVAELQGVVSVPLYIGAMTPGSEVPADILAELMKARPRDVSRPAADPPGPNA
jgi:hypothetical protein